MIVFDLLCADGHRFESWFQNGAAFERQQAECAVACPLCGSRTVAKAPMAPHVARAAERTGEHPSTGPAGPPAEMLEVLRQLREHIENNCDYVGATFLEEVRRIFYGETECRDIYGEASAAEAEALQDEGIDVQPVPWLFRRND
jgi:hypothetical protein